MKIKDIVSQLAEKHNLTKKVVSEVISDYENLIIESAKKEGKQRTKNMTVKVVERWERSWIAPNWKKWKTPKRKVIVINVKKSLKVVK